MPNPSQYRFSESHEWFHQDGDTVTAGITQYAADELTDVTFVEMRPVGTKVAPGDSLGEVESVKTTSDVYSVVAGEIMEVNKSLANDPSLVNSDPYGKGWLVKIRAADTSSLQGLMDQRTYDERYPVG